jgi:thiosulfate/3-mercaptopyruvate sulfurtransferase
MSINRTAELDFSEPLVSTEWLAAHGDDPRVRVIDCRWYLRPFDDREGRAEYLAGHIPGAVHVRWDTELADPDRPASMIAGPERYAEAMGRLGVGDDTFVVTYDDLHVPVAARVWWTLRLYGHDRVAVLDGGLPAWRAEHRPIEPGAVTPAPATFTPAFCPHLYATKADVLERLETGDAHLVDGRMDSAYESASGHIPTSVRLPGLGFLTDDGHWVGAERARELVAAAGVDDGEPVIAYCGGGVAATGTALGFRLAGLGDVAVYDGSWTEWSADPATPKELHG